MGYGYLAECKTIAIAVLYYNYNGMQQSKKKFFYVVCLTRFQWYARCIILKIKIRRRTSDIFNILYSVFGFFRYIAEMFHHCRIKGQPSYKCLYRLSNTLCQQVQREINTSGTGAVCTEFSYYPLRNLSEGCQYPRTSSNIFTRLLRINTSVCWRVVKPCHAKGHPFLNTSKIQMQLHRRVTHSVKNVELLHSHTTTVHTLTGPVGQLFACWLRGQRFTSWGYNHTSGTRILLLSLSRYIGDPDVIPDHRPR
jgi:hypothetical protein